MQTSGGLTADLIFTYLPADVTGDPATYSLIRRAAGVTSILAPASPPTNVVASVNGVTGIDGQWSAAQVAGPAFTSAASTGFTVGVNGSFTVAASGQPKPAFSILSGTLPSGLTLDGTTGALSGTPAMGTAGSYPLLLNASNSAGPDATQISP